jgi:hypothetical protein
MRAAYVKVWDATKNILAGTYQKQMMSQKPSTKGEPPYLFELNAPFSSVATPKASRSKRAVPSCTTARYSGGMHPNSVLDRLGELVSV